MAAAHDELAAGAVRQPVPIGIDEPVLLVGHAAPHAVGPAVGFVGRQEADALALRHAIHQEQTRLGQRRAQALDRARGQRRGGIGDQPDRAEVEAGQLRHIQQGREQSRHAGQHGDLLALQALHQLDREGGLALEHHGGAQAQAHQQVVQAVAVGGRQGQTDDVALLQGEVGLD